MIGKLCLSYDFELAWGCRNNSTDPAYGEQYEATWQTIPRMLRILESFEIPSTWATVGALMLEEDCDFSPLREYAPNYPWFRGVWYDIPKYSSSLRKRYYAPELIESILACPTKQEIATHTFTHIYASDPATSPELFDLELEACHEVARRWGVRLRSIVYPRNMVAHLDMLRKHNIKIFRSLDTEWYWFGHRFPTRIKAAKGIAKIPPFACAVGRLLNEKLAIAPPVFPLSQYEGIAELKHSCFLPGYSGVSKFVSAQERVRRMCKGIDAAIRKRAILSVYFHPHNFNYRSEDCLETFAAICRYAAKKRDEGVLEIVTMADIGGERDGHAKKTPSSVLRKTKSSQSIPA